MCRSASSMNWLVFCLFLLFSPPLAEQPVIAQENLQLTEGQVDDGWLSLFDQKTLFGWKSAAKSPWQIIQGALVCWQGQRGLLCTTAQFDDFELTLEFKAGPDVNSGVFIRTSPLPADVLRDCYEINIAAPELHEYSTGAIVGRQTTDTPVALDPDRWHKMRILADGPLIKVWVDDQRTVSYQDSKPLGRGYIGLQYNQGRVWFRNIAIRPLNLKPLFDGKGLDQWNLDLAQESQFSMTSEGELQILGGPGQIESKSTFGDFVLSLRCKTNASGLNSGVFFRSIPGQLMNGYESQIQNQFLEDDPSRPKDCGTGGIFRRQDARLVVSRDQEWFNKTIIATGNHFSVWVDGIQVTDWTDGRESDPNPRRGFRAEAGTIILQGHDPTTDLLFDKIHARELSPRGK